MTMKNKPNVSDFLKSGEAELSTAKSAGVVHKKQKVVFLPVSLLHDIKQRALDESARKGVRVTETEIIEIAIQNHLYK